MDKPPATSFASDDEQDGFTKANHGSQSAVSTIKNAINRLSHKKKDKVTGATSNFFLRNQKSTRNVQQPQQQTMFSGPMLQVSGGTFPSVWAAPQGSPKRKAVSPSLSFRSPTSERISIPSFVDSKVEAKGAEQIIPEPMDSNPYVNELEQDPNLVHVSSSRSASGGLRAEQLSQLLKCDVLDLDKLKELSWGGIPQEYRPTAWKLLLGYMPTNQDRREAMIERKRQEYMDLLQRYYNVSDTDRGMKEQNTLRQILVDIPRTNADVPLFKNERIHQCMERILYIWAIRHPASGYVQGINDLLTPFLVVFLSPHLDSPLYSDLSSVSDEQLVHVEADSYWCLTKLLDGIQDHYTFAQPGLQRMVQRMEELVNRCDADLFRHIVEEENLQFVQFAFRWMNCLLMREIPLQAIVRVWDTYLCEDHGFEGFHVYVCTAILMTFGEQLKQMEFQDLVLFLQNLPTKDWIEEQIDPLLSRAYILQTYFADAPNHLS